MIVKSAKLIGAVSIAAALLTGCSTLAEAQPPTGSLDTGSLGGGEAPSDLVSLVSGIKIGDEAKGAGYNRDDYPHWGTADPVWNYPAEYSKCTTRDYVLFRDGKNINLDPKSCKITVDAGGGWTDPYGKVEGGKVVYPTASAKGDMDIDHVVALKEVWRSGGGNLSPGDREAIANDPVNLFATTAAVNRSKGDSDAADYLPPDAAFRCTYIEHYARVKVGYGLTAQQAEYDRLIEEAKKCQ